MHQLPIALSPRERHLHGLRHLFGLQALMHVPADDLPRIRIRDQAQINKLAVCGQVGDVSHPGLFAGAGANLLWPGFEQVRMAPEAVAVVTVCCLVVRPPGCQ